MISAKLRQRWLPLAALLLTAILSATATAEDIDLFIGGPGGSRGAHVLVIIDNTSNWASAAQHWPNEMQGQAELAALIQVVPTLKDNVSVAVMLFNTNGLGNCCSGGYLRFPMLPMTDGTNGTADNKTALVTALQNILNNFADPANKAASNASYSMALFDAFKYLGGYTSPAHATDNVAGAPVDAFHFGPPVFATPPSTFNQPAQGAYTDASFTVYNPPSVAADACGVANYIVFIGNGFPNTDTAPSENMATILQGIGGDTTQLQLPVLTTTTTTVTSALPGYTAACYAKNKNGQTACSTANAGACGAGYDTCTCSTPTTGAGCAGGTVKYTLVGGYTTTTVKPTGTWCAPGTAGCPYAASTIRYADEWTKYLFDTDVNPAAGQQNVRTFTIDAFNAKQDANQTALMFNMANVGGGKYYAARSRSDVANALTEIFNKIQIQATDSAFASASLPISATNRAVNANEVYIGMFRPDVDAKPLWYGNLKRYQIGNFNGSYNLADSAGLQAVDPLTGFVDDCATSWWTTDSKQFWWDITTTPPPNSSCAATEGILDPYSDKPDGPHVEKGSVAEVLRSGNNPAGPSTWALNRTVYTKGFVAFNTMNSGMAAADVDFVRGLNVDAAGNYLTYQYDPADATKTTTIRPTVHGDVVHARPLPINYGATTVVYYGAIDGTFRAVDSATGKELWAYVASEFYSTLTRLRQDSPLISYATLDPTTISPPPIPKNYYFDGSVGLYQNADNSKVWIYPTMRRGGRMIYAFDVTTPSAPALKWKVGCPDLADDVGCTSSDFTAIGQTWSAPNLAALKIGGTVGETPAPVVAVGGGYDNCEDGSPNAACSGAKGSIVYFLDANTGGVLKAFNIKGFKATGRVAADIAYVDLDGDGIPDFAYAADTRGNIYRISFGMSRTAPLAAANWTATLIAYTTGSNRKFLYAPAVLPSRDGSTGKYYVYLALGTGDREQPLESQYPYATPVLNRFYVYMDDVTVTSASDLDSSTAMSDFSANTSCNTAMVIPGSGKSGWFMDLDAYGRGEQTVTSAVIVGGFVAFSTNRAVPRTPNTCAPLGEARGYAVNLFNASGVIGAQPQVCGGARSGVFTGGGFPPSPVVSNVDIGGKVEPIGIGVVNLGGGASSGIESQKVFSLPKQRRTRVYWRQEGDN